MPLSQSFSSLIFSSSVWSSRYSWRTAALHHSSRYLSDSPDLRDNSPDDDHDYLGIFSSYNLRVVYLFPPARAVQIPVCLPRLISIIPSIPVVSDISLHFTWLESMISYYCFPLSAAFKCCQLTYWIHPPLASSVLCKLVPRIQVMQCQTKIPTLKLEKSRKCILIFSIFILNILNPPWEDWMLRSKQLIFRTSGCDIPDINLGNKNCLKWWWCCWMVK